MLVPDAAMLTGERLKVLDFGLAKLSTVREAALVKTETQAVLGTPLYMSPEQCEGAGHIDTKTDVYSLGCMLYEMLSGRAPFLGEGPGQVIGQHLFKEPEPLAKLAPQIPAALSDLVHRLLIKSKEERPTMRETQKALEALAGELPPPHRHESADPSGAMSPNTIAAMGLASTLGQGAGETGKPPSKRRPPAFAVVAGAGAIAVLIGSLLVFRQVSVPRKVPPPPVVVQAQPPAPKLVTTRVDSEPTGALVIRVTDSEILGKTPWQRQSEAREGELELTLRLAGHSDQSVFIKLSTDDHAYVALTPKPTARTRTRAASREKKEAAPTEQRPVVQHIKNLAGKIADKFERKPAIRPYGSSNPPPPTQPVKKSKTR